MFEQPAIISHWYTLVEDFQHSPQDCYQQIEQAIAKREVPKLTVGRSTGKEGGMLSASREYLRVYWKDYIFDICAAPYGKGFFFSWWLIQKQSMGCLRILLALFLFSTFIGIPLIYFLIRTRTPTYFEMDTSSMFQEAIRKSVLEVVDAITKPKGIRALSDDERKPILREFYRR